MSKKLFVIISIFVFFLSACVNDERKNEPIANDTTIVAIPDVFKNDSITTKHLTELSNNLENFSSIIEDLADEIDALGIKDLKKPGVLEKLQLMKIILPKTEPIVKLVNNIQLLDKKSEKIKDTLSTEKKIAFESFEESFKNKFDTLNLRFKKYAATENDIKQN